MVILNRSIRDWGKMGQKSAIITQNTGRSQIERQYASEPRLAIWKGNFRTLVSQKRTGEVALLVRKFLDEVANLKAHQYNNSEQFNTKQTRTIQARDGFTSRTITLGHTISVALVAQV